MLRVLSVQVRGKALLFSFVLILCGLFLMGCITQKNGAREHVVFEATVLDTFDERIDKAYEEDVLHYSKIEYMGKKYLVQTGNSYTYISYAGVRDNRTRLEGFEARAGDNITIGGIYDGKDLFVLGAYKQAPYGMEKTYVVFKTNITRVTEGPMDHVFFEYNGNEYNFSVIGRIECEIMAGNDGELTSRGYEIVARPDDPRFYPYRVRADNPIKLSGGDELDVEGIFKSDSNRLSIMFVSTKNWVLRNQLVYAPQYYYTEPRNGTRFQERIENGSDHWEMTPANTFVLVKTASFDAESLSACELLKR